MYVVDNSVNGDSTGHAVDVAVEWGATKEDDASAFRLGHKKVVIIRPVQVMF